MLYLEKGRIGVDKNMSEQSGFFNAQLNSDGTYDREYDARDFAGYFSKFISDGVFLGGLLVRAKDGLTVTVKQGSAFIEGYWYNLTEDKDITLNPNETAYNINDLIVVVLDRANRTIELQKKESVSSKLPVNDETKHELVLCSISLGVGVGEITNAEITDLRSNKDYCGYVTGVVEQIDVGSMYEQFKTQFEEWFDDIKGELSEDAAGNLQLQINDLKSRTRAIEMMIESGNVRATSELPEGFTIDNCVIVSSMYKLPDSHELYELYYKDSSYIGMRTGFVKIEKEELYVSVPENTMGRIMCKVTLMKLN